MPPGQAHHHDAGRVPGFEIPAKAAKQVIAVPLAVLAIDHDLADDAERAGDRHRHVGQGERQQLSLTGGAAVPFGGEDAARRP